MNEFRKVRQKLYDRRTGAHGKQVADLALFQISMPSAWSQIISQLEWRTCILDVYWRTGRWSERIPQPVHYSSHAGGVARRLTTLQGR